MKMILIQDGSQNTNVDKPLRIIGDPYKVQVSTPRGTGLRVFWEAACLLCVVSTRPRSHL